MKKFLIIFTIILIAVGGLLAYIFIPKNTKISADFITITENQTVYYSNKKSSGEYNTYQITFTPSGTNTFGEYSLKTSNNITTLSSILNPNNSVVFQFKITESINFFITLQSTNYQDKVFKKSCTPYNQYTDLNLEFNKITRQDNSKYYIQKTTISNISKFVLYYVQDENYKQTATNENFPTSATFEINNTVEALKDYTINVSNVSQEYISFNTETKTITTLKAGNASIRITCNDGSGVEKLFYFVIKNPFTRLDNIPNEINLTYPSLINPSLPNLTVIPAYSNGINISFESADTSYFTIENNKLVSKKIGTSELKVFVDLEYKISILVNITNATPAFKVDLADNHLGDKISLNNNNLILNYNDNYSINTYVSISLKISIINVEAENFEGDVYSSVEQNNKTENLNIPTVPPYISNNGVQAYNFAISKSNTEDGALELVFYNDELNISLTLNILIK